MKQCDIKVGLGFGLWMFFVNVGQVFAQGGGKGGGSASGDGGGFSPDLGEGLVVVELFKSSFMINSIILLLSVLAVVLFVYFLLTVEARTMAPSGFVNDMTRLVGGGQFEEAATLCRSRRDIFLANILQRCFENADKSQSVVLDILDTEGKRRADILWNRVSYLADIANVAPMLGLLGTVVGMIKAFFFALPEGSASISSKVLSQAIGGAMATTMFGLIVAIIALGCYSVVKGRLTQALAEIEQVSHGIVDHIHSNGGGK